MSGNSTGKLLVQPFLVYDQRPPSLSGKGFVVVGEDNRPFVVTSATYFFRGDAQVKQVEWFDLLGEANFATSTSTWGEPGIPPAFDPVDFQFNFMLFQLEAVPAGFQVLQVDPRPLPKEGEEVWFPKASSTNPNGFERVKGTIDEVSRKYIDVILDEEITVRDQSGCPLISAVTGQVIGVFYGGIPMAGITKAYFSPAYEIYAQLREPREEIPLGPSRMLVDNSS
jgi:hypothetical protein